MPFSVLWAAASGISAWSWVQRHLPAWHLHRAQGDQSPLLCGNSWGLQLHAGHWVLAGFVWCVNLAQFFRVLTLIPPDCTFQIRPAAIKTGSGERSLKPKRQCRKRWQCNEFKVGRFSFSNKLHSCTKNTILYHTLVLILLPSLYQQSWRKQAWKCPGHKKTGWLFLAANSNTLINVILVPSFKEWLTVTNLLLIAQTVYYAGP